MWFKRGPKPARQLPLPQREFDVLSSDLPLTEIVDDEFGRAGFASRIAEAIVTRTAAATLIIGVYGPWGSGKTTVLQFVRAELEDHDVERFPVVTFNPWRYGSEELLVQGLFDTLADALQLSLPDVGDKIGGWLQVAGGAAGALTLTGSGAEKIMGKGVKAAGRLLSQRTLDRDRAKLNTALRESGKRIVVMLDDIDRLDRHEIVTILRAVKLAADFDNLVYVLAFDHARVAAALADRYPDGGGADFLDKMVQLPLLLPRVDPVIVSQRLLRDVGRLIARHTAPLDAATWRLVSTLNRAVLPRVRTARDHTLYLNALEFAVPAHRGELNVVDVVLLEALRLFYPAGYALVSSNKELILGIADTDYERAQALRTRFTSVDVADEDREPLTILLKAVFPQFDVALNSRYHSRSEAAEWIRDRRACTARYFDRYFTYGLPPGDIADNEIDSTLHDGVTTFSLAALIGKSDPVIVLAKLLDRVPVLSADSSLALVQAIAATAERLPPLAHDKDFSGPRWQASVLAVHLLARLTASDRRPVAIEMMRTSDIEFATLVQRWLPVAETSNPGEPLMPDADINTVVAALTSRLLDLDLDTPLIDRYGALALQMYKLAFHCAPERASEQLATALHDRTRLARILRTYMVSPTATESTAPPVSTFLDNQGFASLTSIIPADILTTAATATSPVGLSDNAVIDRFLAYIQRTGYGVPGTRPLPDIAHEPTHHPLANRHPASALGGSDPHNSDLAIRVSVLIPAGAGTPMPQDPPTSLRIGQDREEHLVRLLNTSPITPWLGANLDTYHASRVVDWQPTAAHGYETTVLTSDLLTGSDGLVPVRATVTVMTGRGQTRSHPSLLIDLDISFALLDRDENRHRINMRSETTPAPAPAALTLPELVDAIEAALGIIDTANQVASLLLPPGSRRAAIGTWISSRTGLDRVINVSNLAAVGNGSTSEDSTLTYRQLGPTPLGQAAPELIGARDFAVACIRRMLNALNRRGYDDQLEALRTPTPPIPPPEQPLVTEP